MRADKEAAQAQAARDAREVEIRRAAERGLRRILDQMPTAVRVFVPGSGAGEVFVNERFTQLFGYDPAEIRSLDDWFERAYPDAAYRARTREWWNAVAADPGRRDSSSREVRIVCKDGTPRDVLASVAAVDDLLLTTFVDLTARKRAEADVRARQLELAEAQRIAHVGSWTHDLATDTVEWSQETYRIFGFWPGRPSASFEELRNLLDPIPCPGGGGGGAMRGDGRTLPGGAGSAATGRGNPARHRARRARNGRTVRLRGTVADVTDCGGSRKRCGRARWNWSRPRKKPSGQPWPRACSWRT
jgi:PAS domain S-box-containing protein